MKKPLACLAATLLPLTASAATDITVGGAVRFQYTFEDYDNGNRERVGDLDLDRLRDRGLQLALRALDGDDVVVHRDLDTSGDVDGESSDS